MVTVDELRVVLRANNQELLRAIREGEGALDSFGRRGQASARDLGSAFDASGAAIGRAMGLMARMDLVQLTLQGSTERLTNAEERYQDALREHGPMSEQAANASRQLDAALRDVEKTQVKAQLSAALVGLEVANLIAQLPRGARAAREYASGIAAAVGQMSAFRIIATGGLALVAVAGGLLAARELMRGFSGDTKAATEQVRSLMDAEVAAQQAKAAFQQGQRGVTDPFIRAAAGVDDPFGPLKEHYRGLVLTANDALAELPLLSEVLTSEKERLQGIHQANSNVISGIAASYEFLASKHQEMVERVNSLQPRIADPLIAESERLVAAVEKQLDTVGQWKAGLDELAGAGDLAPGLAAALDKLAHELFLAGKGEAEFHAAARKNIPVLFDQMSVTKKKGETTEDLVKRLGLTTEEEKKLREAGRLTEEGIISQEEAMRRQAAAAKELQEEQRRLLEQQRQQLLGEIGTARTSANVTVEGGTGGPGPGVVDLELQRIGLLMSRDAARAQSAEAQAYFASLRSLATGGYVSDFALRGQREAANRVLYAADGFHGWVTGPTPIVAGERGRERVDIWPDGQGPPSAGASLTVNHNYYGPADPRQVEDADFRAFRRIGAGGRV